MLFTLAFTLFSDQIIESEVCVVLSKNNSQVTLARNNEVMHKRLYKSKHGWNIAAMGALTLGAGMLGTMSVQQQTVHADTVTPAAQQDAGTNVNMATAQTATEQSGITEGSSVIQGPTTPTSVTPVTPVVNSGNTAVAGAFSSQHNAIEDAGGTLNQASTVRVTVNESNASSAESFVNSDLNSQLSNINATASADASMASYAKSDVDLANKIGAKVHTGSALDVSSLNADSIASMGKTQADRLSAVGSANGLLSNEVAGNSNVISQAGGTLVPGSAVNTDSMTPEQIASAVSSMADMISATGSADSALVQASQNNTSAINAAGGQLKRSDVINTADNMTVSDVASTVSHQVNQINAVGSADALVKSIYDANASLIAANGGKLVAGSVIDASKLTPDQIAKLVAGQSAMISATAQGDQEVTGAVKSNSGAIAAVSGAALNNKGQINTADNMTVSQVLSMAKVIKDRINATGDADKVVKSALDAASAAGVKIVLGSATDTTSMTPVQIKTAIDAQSAMISATVKADVDVLNTASAVKSAITKVGGKLIQNGVYNTADNMTVGQVLSLAAAQDVRMKATASADTEVDKALSDASAAGVKVVLGPTTDTTLMTPEQIASDIAGQSAMISATIQAGSDINKDVKSAEPQINGIGGHITKNGTVNTADNMTVSDVESSVQSQSANISETASGDVVISGAVKSAVDPIAAVSGVVKAGSGEIDTTKMTSEEIASIVAHQTAMLSATAKADTKLTSEVAKRGGDITKIGGTISQSGFINTADNMTVSQVKSLAKSQNAKLSEVASGDIVISDAVSGVSDVIEIVSGALKPGASAIDATKLTSDQIASVVAHQSAMLHATDMADTDLTITVDKNASDITKIGGLISQAGLINTADNMTVSQINSIEASQHAGIVETASGDIVVSKAVDNASGAIAKVSGALKPGSGVVDASKLTSAEIASFVAQQSAMLSTTAQADNDLTSEVAKTTKDITNIGGTISQNGLINTADHMTVSEVASTEASQNAKIGETASGDVVISKAVDNVSGAIAKVSGALKPGAGTIDTTKLTSGQIASIVAHQSAMLSATGSADNDLTSAVGKATSDITKIGGTISQNGLINTADHMTVSEVSSTEASQNAKIGETASGDVVISKAVDNVSGAIAKVSGTLKPGASAIDATNLTSAEIASVVAHQSAMLSATAKADDDITSAVASASGNITKAGGTITQSGLVNTADNMTVEQIQNAVKSQIATVTHVAAGDASITKEQEQASRLSAPFGGHITTGKALDVTGMDVKAIDSLAQSQVVHMSMVASGNVELSETQVKASDVVNAVGGQIKAGSNVDTTSMTPTSLASMINYQNAQLSAVGDGDRQIGSALTNNMNSIENFGAKILSAGAINMADKTADEIEANAKSQAANIVATGQGDFELSNAVNSDQSLIEKFGTLTRNEASDVTSLSGSEVKSLADSKVANLSAAGSGAVELSTAFASASAQIGAFGGSVTKGNPVDVSNMTPDKIKSLVSSEAALLSATGSADVKLSQTVSQNVAGVKAVGGDIHRAADVDTSSMSVDQITQAVNAQVQQIINVHSEDVKLNNAMNSAKVPMGKVGGAIHIGREVIADSMSVDTMNSIVASQVAQMSYAASADTGLSSAIVANTAAITKHGGTITSTTAVDATKMSSDEINNNMMSQASNISDVAFGDTTLNNAVETNASAAVQGAARDFTGDAKAGISSFVASQVVAIGRATDLDRVADSYANDLKGYGNISVTTSTVDVHTAEEISSYAKANTNAESQAIDASMKHGSGSATLVKVRYVYTPLSVTYKAFDVTNTPLSVNYHVYSNHGTATPLSDSYTPYSTSFHALSDLGGYHALDFATTPLSVTYQGYESDGSKISPVGKDGKINPNFTGYAPLSVTYKGFESDGSKINPVNADGTINDNFTGYAPLSVTYKGFESDGSKISPVDKDGKINPNFTGYVPLSITYKAFESDGSKLNPVNEDGTINEHFTGYAPLSVTYKGFESDGSKISPVDKDGKLNPNFTGYAPLSTTYKDYESDGTKVPKGHKFTGMTSFSTTYKRFESDGSKVKSGDKFTGMTPFSTDYQTFESDGSKVPTGHNFTGLAPFSTTYQPYTSDGSKVKAADKFTGFAPFNVSYRPLSTKYHFYQDVKAPEQKKETAQTEMTSTPAVQPQAQAQGQAAPAVSSTPVAAATVSSPALVSGGASAPAQSQPASAALPQTGTKDQGALALLGLVMLASTMGLSVLNKRRQEA